MVFFFNFNLALITKLGLKVVSDEDAVWVRTLRQSIIVLRSFWTSKPETVIPSYRNGF